MSDEPFFHFLPALLKVRIACDHSTFATCYSVGWKKSGGVRLVAIAFALRRLSSKCANAFGVNQLKSFISPITVKHGSAYTVVMVTS